MPHLTFLKKMEKTILVVFGREWAESTAELACFIASECRAKLTGIFLEETVLPEKPEMRNISGTTYVETVVASTVPGYKEGRMKTEKNIEAFQFFCERKVTIATAKRMYVEDLNILTEESRFADILIVGAAAAVVPSGFLPSPLVQALLHNAQCPVLIAPKFFSRPEEVVFAYDGSPSALVAMKLFTYILPELTEMKATVVKVNRHDRQLPGETGLLNAWLSRHYAYTDVIALKGDVEEELDVYLSHKRKPILVMGAYGRSAVSRLFRASHADYLMEVLNFPIFITHQ